MACCRTHGPFFIAESIALTELLLKIGTGCLMCASAAMLALGRAEPGSSHARETTTPSASKFLDFDHDQRTKPAVDDDDDPLEVVSQNDAMANRSGPQLRVGKIEKAPSLREVPRLTEFPMTESAVRAAYHAAADRRCTLVMADNPVTEPLPIAAAPALFGGGCPNTLGRLHAMTIDLALDDAGRERLPNFTIGQVESYFDTHRVSIQPEVLFDGADGFYFSGRVWAAFFDKHSATSTLAPEPMIRSAVERFCGLGLLGSPSKSTAAPRAAIGIQPRTDQDPKSLGRTMAMAFSYEQLDANARVTSQNDESRYVFELLLFHLPIDFEPQRPKIEVFITERDRTSLRRLHTGRGSVVGREGTARWLRGPEASLIANVRFGSTTLMGLYPAKPIVSDIRFEDSGGVDLAKISSAIRRDTGILSTILDDFDRHVSESASAGNVMVIPPRRSEAGGLRRTERPAGAGGDAT